MEYINAFWVGGAICALVQILLDRTKLMPGRVMVLLVCTGAVLGFLGIYQPFVEFAGGGASVPLLGFGNTLWNGVKEAVVTGGPDAVTGEHAVVFIYADDASIRHAVEETIRQMPFYLQNTEVFLLHIPFPKNRNGKTDIKKLCVLAREELI